MNKVNDNLQNGKSYLQTYNEDFIGIYIQNMQRIFYNLVTKNKHPN